ncbi:MAG: hypothetical protein U0003_04530 [Vampirovibrionales bacterium]
MKALAPGIYVQEGLGDDGQPQWFIQVDGPLSTEALAHICRQLVILGGTIRTIAFVAPTPLAFASEDSMAKASLTPRLQLSVQGATLATQAICVELNQILLSTPQ